MVADPPDSGRFRRRNRKNKHRIPELKVGGCGVSIYIHMCIYIHVFLWGGVCIWPEFTQMHGHRNEMFGFSGGFSLPHFHWPFCLSLLSGFVDFLAFWLRFPYANAKGTAQKTRLAQGFIYLMATNRQLNSHQVTRGWVNEKCASL